MARVTREGKRTFWHLRGTGRVPSEYEIVSTRLIHFGPGRFEVNTPVAEWYARHHAERALALPDWDAFCDPERFTYAAYVARRRDDELFVQRLLEADQLALSAHGRSSEQLALYRDAVGPLRFPCHGLAMASAYVAHLAPGSRLMIALCFQSADEVRRVQRLAHRLWMLPARATSAAGAPSSEQARAFWQEHPAWQPLRRAIEVLLCTYGWAEAFTSLHVVLKPAIDRVVFGALERAAERVDDRALAQVLAALSQDGAWHRECTGELVRALVRHERANFETLRRCASAARPSARDAVSALAPVFGEESGTLESAFDSHYEQTLKELELV
jgi:toluene monooxygenase system protein E